MLHGSQIVDSGDSTTLLSRVRGYELLTWHMLSPVSHTSHPPTLVASKSNGMGLRKVQVEKEGKKALADLT